MAERLASDIAADLRKLANFTPSEPSPLLLEAADKLDGLIVLLAQAEQDRDEARRERDLAVAHDRQPYPTQWAYDQACKALEKHRSRANALAVAMLEVRRGACAYSDLNTATATNHDVIAAYVNDVHRLASDALAKDDDVCSREPDLTDPERAVIEAARAYRVGFTPYFEACLGPNRGPGTIAAFIAAVDALESRDAKDSGSSLSRSAGVEPVGEETEANREA